MSTLKEFLVDRDLGNADVEHEVNQRGMDIPGDLEYFILNEPEAAESGLGCQ